MPDTGLVQSMVQLVAAHGVYALTVIFLFYQQRRAVSNLRRVRTPEDKTYFRKIHTSVVVATYTLVLISTGVWIYATFFDTPVTQVRGVVTGLSADPDVRPEVGDDPVAFQLMAPVHQADVDFYGVPDAATLMQGEYSFKWSLWTRQDMQKVAFRLRHHFIERQPQAAHLMPDPFGGLPRSATGHQEGALQESVDEHVFALDLSALNYSPTQTLHMTYEPDARDTTALGKVWLHPTDGDAVELHYVDEHDAAPTKPEGMVGQVFDSITQYFGVLLLAQSEPVFKEDGSFDPRIGEALTNRLAGSDLNTQVAARDVLVENGSRSFNFILAALDRSPESAVLIHNLSEAVEEIEARGTPFPTEGHLKLAMAFYSIRDYQRAAVAFDHAAGERKVDDATVYYRAYAYDQVGRYADSIQNYQELLTRGSYPSAQNNLAYLYARQKTNLERALSLVDEALSAESDNPHYLDTKGWVLFQLGEYEAARPLLQAAVDAAPTHEHVQHLAEIEAALRSRRR